MTRRLLIGGETRHEGWEVLNISPDFHVDHVCDAGNLSIFPDNTFSEIYASHVVEHFDYVEALPAALREWLRVLEPGGKALISVPDMDVLCRLFLSRTIDLRERFRLMRMLFGGHLNEHDYHVVGLNLEFLTVFLNDAGFVNIRRVHRLNRFEDTSIQCFRDTPISLNVIAEKAKSGGAAEAGHRAGAE